MTFDERLEQLADSYRRQGYTVVVAPGPAELPGFAKHANVELLATRPDGCVFVSAKKNRAELEADTDLARFAELLEKQPGWRLDLAVLPSEGQPAPARTQAQEPSEADISHEIDKIARLLDAGFAPQALVAGWSVLEAAMRQRLRSMGQDAGWGLSPRSMLNELYSNGVLQGSALRDLEALFHLRSAIVHGFATPDVRKEDVQFLIDTAQSLTTESPGIKKIA